ncbi:hypothetical protein JTE90_020202, partial [Oedothorax gibbosus]
MANPSGSHGHSPRFWNCTPVRSIKVARLKIAHGQLLCLLQRLYPMEMTPDSSDGIPKENHTISTEHPVSSDPKGVSSKKDESSQPQSRGETRGDKGT